MAKRSAVPSTDSASVTFATLVGPSSPRSGEGPPARTERQLLATVTHELRNPLASLTLSLDMAIAELGSMEARSALALLECARRSACWLQSLTDNLTNAACLDAGRLDVRPQRADVLECVQSAIELLDALLAQRRQAVRVTASTGSTFALADPARVVQVVANLLSNACRYSVEDDTIEVHLSNVGHALRIRVTDHGPGIAPEEQERIFGDWTRGHSATHGGLGLGLSIVRDLVQNQGGRVGVESALGQGATFWFTLPLADTCER